MRIEVNETKYNIEIIGDKVRVNDDQELVVALQLNKDEIMIEDKTFHLDFVEEGEPSFMIINGMIYVVSKGSLINALLNEIKAPISGKIKDVFATVGSVVKEEQVLFSLEAMKMENRIKCPVAGKTIKEIKVIKGQSVMTGQVLLIFNK